MEARSITGKTLQNSKRFRCRNEVEANCFHGPCRAALRSRPPTRTTHAPYSILVQKLSGGLVGVVVAIFFPRRALSSLVAGRVVVVRYRCGGAYVQRADCVRCSSAGWRRDLRFAGSPRHVQFTTGRGRLGPMPRRPVRRGGTGP